MKMKTKGVRLICVLSILVAFSGGITWAHAANDSESEDASDSRFPIAVPAFATSAGAKSYGAGLAAIVARDLKSSQVFRVVRPDYYPPGFTGVPADVRQLNLDAWEDTTAQFLVYGFVSIVRDEIVLEARLFDVLRSCQIVGKELRTPKRLSSRAARLVADEFGQMLKALHAWKLSVKRAVEQHWTMPDEIETSEGDRDATVIFRVDRNGQLVGTPEIIDQASDQAVGKTGVDAILAAAPFAPLPDDCDQDEQQVEYVFTLRDRSSR